MLIEQYELELVDPACHPGAERYSAHARLTTDISECLPFLNAKLRGAVYQPAANALTWKKNGHHVAFRAQEIATSNVLSRAEAVEEIERLVALVNDIWEHRAETTPDHSTHQRPTPMALLQLLPQTNCRQCGEATCFAFALKLAARQKGIEACPPLSESPHADRIAALQDLLIDPRG